MLRTTQAALDTGQKVSDGWGGPRFQRGQGRSAHVGRLKEGKKEPRLLEWGWGRPEPHSVQSGGRYTGLGKAAPVNSPQFSTTPYCQPPVFVIQLSAAATNSKRAVTV